MLPSYVPDYSNFVPGQTPVLYSGPHWDEKEIEAATKALTTGKWLTSGEYVARFQNEFSRMFGVKYSHMVNSGSSANLVMIAALKERMGWADIDEVLVSPVGFPTTVAPLVQNGLKPVFVDIEMRTLNFDLSLMREKITPRTRAIFVSPVLGNPPDMDELVTIAGQHGLHLIGDNCDSLGSKWDSFHISEDYLAWSSSFYPAHHITVGQGGMVSSNDKELIDLVRSFSTWGRDCYCVGAANLLACGTCGKRFSNWLNTDAVIDHKYVFTQLGYNLAPALDMQGAIGLEQLKKFPEIDRKRKEHYAAIASFFSGDKVRVADRHLQADPCPFGVPIICDSMATKNSLVSYLELNKIQTRQYFAGNLLRHPAYSHLDDASKYPNADRALNEVFFLGVYPGYSQAVLEYIGGVVNKWKNSPS
jgi:CDP-4-dehydro-6-deoxyglucose reductase, E1